MIKNNITLLAVITLLLLALEYFFTANSTMFTRNIIMTGTLILALIHFAAFYISYKAAKNPSPHKFVTGVTASTLLKLCLCAGAAGIYIYLHKNNLHKPDIFLLMFIYLFFTVLETFITSKSARNKQ